MFKLDPHMGEEVVIYRVRDIDLRARRTGEPSMRACHSCSRGMHPPDHTSMVDSNSSTRSFGASMDLLRRASDHHRQSPMTLNTILEVRRSPNVHEQTC